MTVVLESPANALPLGCRPGLSRKIAAAEALQLIGAFSDPPWLVALAPQFSRYLEPDGTSWGAYGARIGRQAARVVDKLRSDPHTRQGVVQLWNAELDNEPGKLDYPCTVALGFSRGGRLDVHQLNMRVVMRSNDVWLGLPYDLFQFAQLQWTLANVLDVIPGTYVHTAWNMHLYDDNLEVSYDVTEPVRNRSVELQERQPTGMGWPHEALDDVARRAHALALGRDVTPHDTNEKWFYGALFD